MLEPLWIEAYTVEGHWPFGYKVVFEEKPLFWFSWQSTAEMYAKALNGAYNLGRAYEAMFAEIEEELALKGEPKNEERVHRIQSQPNTPVGADSGAQRPGKEQRWWLRLFRR